MRERPVAAEKNAVLRASLPPRSRGLSSRGAGSAAVG